MSCIHRSGSKETQSRGLDDRGRLEGGLHRLYLGAQTIPPRWPKKRWSYLHPIAQQRYVVVGGNLYKHESASGILMKCVSMEEGKEILQEIHEGVCGNHTASRTLVGKAFCSYFY
jgi:hypothetical protein